MKPATFLFSVVLLAVPLLGQSMPGGADRDTPLLKMSLGLQLARARVLDGRQQDAAEALRSVAQEIQKYEVLSPGPHAVEAEYIRQQVLETARTMTADSQELADRITYLWLAPVDRWYKDTIR